MKKTLITAILGIIILSLNGCAEMGADKAYQAEVKAEDQHGTSQLTNEDICTGLYPSYGTHQQQFYDAAIKRHLLKCQIPA